MSLQLLNIQHIDDWACGVADARVIALVEEALKDPDSPASRYCDWLRNPVTYLRVHGAPPELVTHQLASLSAETRGGIRTINDHLPSEIHVGDILSIQGFGQPVEAEYLAYKRSMRRLALVLAALLLAEHVGVGIWLARLMRLNGIQPPAAPVTKPAEAKATLALKPIADSADARQLVGYLDAMRVADGALAGGYEIGPAAAKLNWYFVNVGLLPLTRRQPDRVRSYLDLYLANVDRSTFLIEDVASIAEGTRQASDSDAAYAATLFSLANRYHSEAKDDAWLTQHKELLKSIARRVIVGAQTPNGLCRRLVNPAESPCQLMDNCEIYRGLADLAELLERAGDGDAREFEAAANRVANGVASLYDEDEERFHSSDTGEEESFYPLRAAQVFPELFSVPLGGEVVTRRRYDAAWAYLNADGDRWESGEVSDESLQGFPWMLLGYVAAKRGETELARRQLRFFLSKVEAGWPFRALHECGWAIQILDHFASTAPAP